MNTPKYEQLKQIMRENIRNGIWKPGEKIPFEKDLCEQFKMSDITVKKAKADLMAEGLLENLPGKRGTFVRSQPRLLASDLIGVAIDGIRDSFFANMLQGIEDRLWEDHLHPTLCSIYFDIEKVEAYFQSLLQKNAAGMIFAPLKGPGSLENNQRIIDLFAEKHIPVVLIDRYIPGRSVNFVVTNNHQGSKDLTKTLLKKGHRRILVFAGAECSSINERIQGYRDALQEAGLEQDDRLIIRFNDILLSEHNQQQEEFARIRGLVENAGDFTACYTLNTLALQTAMRVLFPKNSRPDRTLEIATYDNNIQELHGITDHVTFVKQPAYKMGWEAANLLIEMIQNPDHPIIQMILKAESIEKEIPEFALFD